MSSKIGISLRFIREPHYLNCLITSRLNCLITSKWVLFYSHGIKYQEYHFFFFILHFFIFVFIFFTLRSGLEKIFLWFMSESVLPMFFSNVFIVLSLTFRSLIHLEFIFMCGVRDCSDFIFLQETVQFSQHHSLKKLSFLHCIFLSLLSKIGTNRCVGFSLDMSLDSIFS